MIERDENVNTAIKGGNYMFFTRFSKPEMRQGLLDAREASNLWEILRAKYDLLEYQQTFQQLAHDPDLNWILAITISTNTQGIKEVEQTMQKYQIASPDRSRLSSNWSVNTEVFRDEFIGNLLLTFLQEHQENLLRCIRTSTTNDQIRNLFINLLHSTIEDTELLIKYLKLKGWIELPPVYINTPPEVKETVLASMASQLWDHVSFRYDNIRKTSSYLVQIHDLDFKMIVQSGLNTLEKQVAVLEGECQKYGIPLPKRPPAVQAPPAGTTTITDDLIFRDIIQGLQVASMIHADAVKQLIHNDRIRTMFIKMLLNEVEYYDRFLKYGKQKGWLHQPPVYHSN